MTPHEIATNWIAKDGEIRPQAFWNEDAQNDRLDPELPKWQQQHTYPCPTLADGEYRGEDLEFYGMKVSDCLVTGNPIYNTAIRLKQQPAIDKGETVEEAAEKAWYEVFQSGKTDPTFDDGFIAGHTHALKGYVRVDEVENLLQSIMDNYSQHGLHFEKVVVENCLDKIKNLTK